MNIACKEQKFKFAQVSLQIKTFHLDFSNIVG